MVSEINNLIVDNKSTKVKGNVGEAMDLRRKILDRIEKEMAKVGMSQAEMGRIMDIKRTDINTYLRGTNTSVSFDRLFEMAKVVGLEVDVVFRKIKDQ